MTELSTFVVTTAIADRQAIAGSDSCITTVPTAVYVQTAGGPALNVALLAQVLRRVSHEQAAAMGATLHHADWVITDDPKVVEERGIHDPTCARCRASIDQVLALLAERPQELLVGILYWAKPR